jgi:REP element-mobilizing transposase RayT
LILLFYFSENELNAIIVLKGQIIYAQGEALRKKQDSNCALKGQFKKRKAMSQSLSKLYVHIVFHIKYNSVAIRKEDKEELYAYMGAIIKDNGSIPIIINGTHNHVHILCVMSKNIALAKLTEEIKRHSSRWIKTKGIYYKQFSWQGGYGGFSVSQSVLDRTKRYIENQEEHHRRKNFKDELLAFYQEYGVEYNEEYLWSD